MKKLLLAFGVLCLLLCGVYFWLMSQGGAEHADQTDVTVTLPIDPGT
jgi:hypothetical protein